MCREGQTGLAPCSGPCDTHSYQQDKYVSGQQTACVCCERMHTNGNCLTRREMYGNMLCVGTDDASNLDTKLVHGLASLCVATRHRRLEMVSSKASISLEISGGRLNL